MKENIKRPIVNETAQMTKEQVDISDDLNNKTLEEISVFIKQNIKKYGKDSEIKYEFSHYDSGFKIKIEYERLETEKETKQRIIIEKRKQMEFDKKEKKEYEKYRQLKKKFG